MTPPIFRLPQPRQPAAFSPIFFCLFFHPRNFSRRNKKYFYMMDAKTSITQKFERRPLLEMDWRKI